jgi:spore maturation protein SpmA
VLNWIWLGLILGGVVYAGFTGRAQAVTDSIYASAKGGVELVIGLVGIMVFLLGLMRVARDGGLLRAVARLLAPLLRRLFPEVPPEHPAMSAMLMNFTANVFGLGNAATPFGLKAMVELERLNPRPGVATDAMILFLAINATSITLMPPTGTVGVREAAGSADPFAIWIPTMIATFCSTATAVAVVYAARAWRRAPAPAPAPARAERAADAGPALPAAEELFGAAPSEPPEPWRKWLVGALALAALAAFAFDLARVLGAPAGESPLREVPRAWVLPLLAVALLLVGVAGRVRVYESAVAGAREGLEVAVRILPYLVVILVAVGIFEASGALDLLIRALDPLTRAVGIPAEVLPMALLRPLSGSGAFAVMADIVTKHGPDSFVGLLACTLQGSTDTTFYVLTLYAGAAGVRDLRHALAACLIGDVAGLLGATAACHLFFA